MPRRITIQSTPADRALQRGARSAQRIKVTETKTRIVVTFYLELPAVVSPKTSTKTK